MRRRENNIRTNLKEIAWDIVDWSHLAQDEEGMLWTAHAVFSLMAGDFLSGLATVRGPVPCSAACLVSERTASVRGRHYPAIRIDSVVATRTPA
jgi:hypothetical protein